MRVEFMMYKVELVQVLLRALLFFLASIIPAIVCTYLPLRTAFPDGQMGELCKPLKKILFRKKAWYEWA